MNSPGSTKIYTKRVYSFPRKRIVFFRLSIFQNDRKVMCPALLSFLKYEMGIGFLLQKEGKIDSLVNSNWAINKRRKMLSKALVMRPTSGPGPGQRHATSAAPGTAAGGRHRPMAEQCPGPGPA